MTQPLTLANRVFSTNLIQGPLAGVSSAPFRELVWQYSQPAFCYTEMISVKTLLYQSPSVQKRYIEKSKQEGPLCFQLSSQDPLELARAVKQVTDYGADLIDLNCGCPMRKIRAKGTGSQLLADPLKLYRLMLALKENTSVPVGIKIRVDGSSSDRQNTQVAEVVRDAGIDFLVVHGRHWTEDYTTSCHYEDIQFFVEALNIPVIGNGDIADRASLKRMLQTGCAGVMLSRAGVGQPWLIAALTDPNFVQPELPVIREMLLQHVSRLALLLGNDRAALLEARRFAKYYARGTLWRDAFAERLNTCERWDDFQTICEIFFNTSRERACSMTW